MTPLFARQSLVIHTTSTSAASSTYKMAPKPADDAASTFSESTTYSYDKPAEKTSKPKRSFRQKMKAAIKELGTSPFEEEEDKHKQSAGWLASMPPSRV